MSTISSNLCFILTNLTSLEVPNPIQLIPPHKNKFFNQSWSFTHTHTHTFCEYMQSHLLAHHLHLLQHENWSSHGGTAVKIRTWFGRRHHENFHAFIFRDRRRNREEAPHPKNNQLHQWRQFQLQSEAATAARRQWDLHCHPIPRPPPPLRTNDHCALWNFSHHSPHLQALGISRVNFFSVSRFWLLFSDNEIWFHIELMWL